MHQKTFKQHNTTHLTQYELNVFHENRLISTYYI